jgi:hypothetical protein
MIDWGQLVTAVHQHLPLMEHIGEGFVGLGVIAGAVEKVKEGSLKVFHVFHRRNVQAESITISQTSDPTTGRAVTQPQSNEGTVASGLENVVPPSHEHTVTDPDVTASPAPALDMEQRLCSYQPLAKRLFLRKFAADVIPALGLAVCAIFIMSYANSTIGIVISSLIGTAITYFFTAHTPLPLSLPVLKLSHNEDEFLKQFREVSKRNYDEFLSNATTQLNEDTSSAKDDEA